MAQNYGTYFKQRINKKGWETFYDPVAMVPYMLKTDGGPGFITYDDEFSTYYRVWYSDWQENLGGTSRGLSMRTTTASRRTCSIRCTRLV